MASGEMLLEVSHDKAVRAVAFSPAGTFLATTGTQQGVARIWDVASGKKLLEIPHRGAVWAAAFSPQGGLRLATGCEDGLARIFAEGKRLEFRPPAA